MLVEDLTFEFSNCGHSATACMSDNGHLTIIFMFKKMTVLWGWQDRTSISQNKTRTSMALKIMEG
jgi:hypothetical protein